MVSSCLCDSSDQSTDPTEYLEMLKRKYLDRTAKLQAQQLELEKKIMKMETFLGKKNKDNDNSADSTCSCDTQAIPKVFPETPVRDIPGIKVISPIKPEQQPVVQNCSFFQKIMENAKSILSIKCQCASAFVSAKSTSVTAKDGGTTSEFTPTDPPTRETDASHPNIMEDETTATDESSKTSICTCDDSNSTLQEASCSCHLESPKVPTVPYTQQVSNDPSSSTPYKESQDPPSTSKSKEGRRRGVPTADCPFNTRNTTSEITSNCSCEECVCNSSMMDDKFLPLEPDQSVTIPKIAVFSGKGDNILNAEVQATTPVQSKGLNIDVAKASKCVTCCRNQSCPTNKQYKKDVGYNVNEGIQAASITQSKAVNILTPTETLSRAVACCKSQMCASNQSATRKQCDASCNSVQAGKNIVAQSTQYQPLVPDDLYFDACFEKCEVARQDGQNQCAFIGSPLLKPMNFEITGNTTSGSKIPFGPQDFKKLGQNSGYSLTSNDIIEMQNIAELAKKEKQMRAQIQDLQKREQQYQEVTKNMNTLVSKTTKGCCSCTAANHSPQEMQQEIKKISQELRLENQYLKSELMDLKVDLKHCLEKVEGPMKHKLQTEKQKCEVLQNELQQASKNMVLSQDAYSREMSQLKLQLCCACANITELNQMNERLKGEMTQLDCLCAKLEEDLVKQKINEADTIKRLTSRRLSGDGPLLKQSDDLSGANLDVIARKLSKTIKELAPCNECSSLPPELAGAAKCIKELTDLVRKRRSRSINSGGCCCAKQPSKKISEEDCCSCCVTPTDRSERKETAKARKKTTAPSLPCECARHPKPVSKPSSKSFLEEDSVLCSCLNAAKNAGGDPSGRETPEEKAVRTLLSVPDNFVQKGISSKFNVDVAASSYYSTTGEPTRDGVVLPCAKIDSPCLENKGTVTKKEDISSAELPFTNKSTKDESLMFHGLENKGTVTIEGDVPSELASKQVLPFTVTVEPLQTEDVPEEDGPNEDIPKDTTPKKTLPCSNIGTPCQKDKKSKADVTTETKIPTSDKACKTPGSKDMLAVKDEEKELGDRRITQSEIEDIARISYDIVDKLPVDDSENAPISEADQLTSGPLSSGAETDTGLLSDGDQGETPQDKIRIKRENVEPSEEDEEMKETQSGVKSVRVKKEQQDDDDNEEEYEEPEGDTIGQYSTEYKGNLLDESPSKREPPPDGIKVGPEIPVEEERIGKFPIDVEVKAYALDEPPDGLHLTTAVTSSGMLEVITEGPAGTIETTMTYTDDGNIEVVTEMIEYEDHKTAQNEQVLEKYTNEPTFRVPRVPEESSSIEKTSDPAFDDPADRGALVQPKLKPIMPILSSKFSGPSGPETDTPYTLSTTSGEGALTSKLATGSSGIKSAFDATPDLAAILPISEGTVEDTRIEDEDGMILGVESTCETGQQPMEVASVSVSGPKSGGEATPSGQNAIRQNVKAGPSDTLTSEDVTGVTSTGDDMPSGEVFTPDQFVSDADEESIKPVKVQPTSVEDFATPNDIKIKESTTPTPAPTLEEMTSMPTTGSDFQQTTAPKSIEFGEVTASNELTVVIVRNLLENENKVTVGPRAVEDKTPSTDLKPADYIDKEEGESTGPQEAFKKSTPALQRTRLPDTSPAGSPATRDCSCQSKDQKDQSCQCCECKTVGITTSGDKETITAEDEEMCKTQQEEAKTDTDSEFVTTSELTDNAQRLEKTKKADSKSKPGMPIRDWGLVVDDQMLEKHPELAGKTSEEQQKMLAQLGYVASKDKMIQHLLNEYPELGEKSPEEQREFLKKKGYSEALLDQTSSNDVTDEAIAKHPELLTMSKSERKDFMKKIVSYVPSEIILDEEMLQKHPELVGISKKEQQKMLREIGYTSSKTKNEEIIVDDNILEKHPELAGKNKIEQQEMLKSLGYVPSKPSKAERIKVDDKVLEKYPELAGKTDEEQQKILKDAGHIVSDEQVVVDQEMLKKHPELAGKSSAQQKQMLENLGYVTPKTASKTIDKTTIEKYPELIGKTSEQQEQILRNLGYETPKAISTIDEDVIQKHPELAGKSSEQQRKILEKLGYSTPKASVRIDKNVLEKHPELIGKSSEQQKQILENLGYETPKTISTIDENVIQKHPELAGKSSEQQREILEKLGYSTPKASVRIDKNVLEKHPELIGKSSEQQKQILENLGYETPKTISTIDESVIQKHPELAGKSSEQQREILENLGYSTPKASVRIDKNMLEKYPELIGKSSEQQKQILADLGYETPKASSIVDKGILKKPSEPAERIIDRQQQVLENLQPAPLSRLGLTFATSEPTPILIDQEMLEKYPELADKSPEQQQQFLENLGYATPLSTSVIIDENMLRDHPELTDKSPEEQQKILADLGYEPKSQVYFEAQESIVKVDKSKPSGTCKAPCKSAEPKQKIAPDLESKPMDELVIKIDKPHPSSKEVSITCKAPCRSAATIHDDSPKPSEKEFTIGDASFASRSVSLQKKPSSKDGSASCKASCRTISVQSFSANAPRNVEIIEAARNGSSSTASSSDSRETEKQKEKDKKKDRGKNRQGEVPSIVSQLSDKDRPVIEPTKKSRAQRKKRSARQVPDCLKCTCEDPCTCVVCSPEKTRKRQQRINRPVRSCDCPSPVLVPTMPMASSMPLPSSSHVTPCACNPCIFNPFTCHPDLVGRSTEEGDSPTSDENDRKKIRRHSSKCECVDCLCLPKIKKLAETREYPVVYDKKQVYHVKTTCGTCENAQNAKRYVEQQRSRIPISTSRANTPKVRSDPAASSSKIDDAGKTSKLEVQKPPTQPPGQLSQSDSIYNSISCDCADCKCADCPDPKKQASKPTKPEKCDEKNDKNCCCQGPCSCKPCAVEELAKKLQEAQQKLDAGQLTPFSAAMPSTTITPSGAPHDEDCTCPECICPGSDLMPGKGGKPAGVAPSVSAPSQTVAAIRPSDECTCPECVTCPESDIVRKVRAGGDRSMTHKPSATVKPSVTIQPSETGEEEECTCPECVCPGAEEKESAISQPKKSGQIIDQQKSSKLKVHPPDCECPECSCPGINDFKKDDMGKSASAIAPPSKSAGALPSQTAAGAGDDDCDCQVCACPGKTSLPPVEGADVIADCDCKDCVCSPCADVKKQKGASAGIAMQQAEISGFPESIADCDCVDCKCSPCADPKKAKGYTGGPQAFTAEVKGLTTKASEIGEHPPECDCPICACPGAGDIPPKESRAGGIPEKISHPPDCDCDDCLCLEEIIKSEIGKEHPEDCDCPVCICSGAGDTTGVAMQTTEVKGLIDQAVQPTTDTAVHPGDCDCDECKCPGAEQTTVDKAVHAPECDCNECKCPGSTEQATHALSCACPECLCPECTVQADHAPGCRCDECLCQSCEYKSTASAGISTFTAAISGIAGVPSMHPGDCSCIKCICDVCSEPTKRKADVKDSTHVSGCKCIECLCKECLLKLEPLKHEEGCKCAQCTCVECLRKMSVGDQLGAYTKECPDIQDEVQIDSKGDNCACEHCICIDCSIKKDNEGGLGIGAQTAALDGNALTPTHDDNCTCAMCQCDPCPEKEGEQPCMCSVCNCVECTKKRGLGVSAQTAAVGGDILQPSHDDKCTCVMCQCDPCPTKDGDQPCTCQVCTCLECNKKRDVGMGEREIGMGDKGTHSPECDCPVCKCEEDTPQEPQVNLGLDSKKTDECDCLPVCTCEAPGDTGETGPGINIAGRTAEVGGLILEEVLDPPPFEPPQRINCDCNKCECIFCAKKKGDTAVQRGGGEIGVRTADISEPPPFEVPVRMDCICNKCTCIFCNKEGPKMKEVAAQQSMTRGIDPPGIAGRTVSVQPSKFLSGKESVKELQKGGMSAADASKPIHCDCPTCTCNEGEIKTTMFTSEIQPMTGSQPFLSVETLELPKPTLDAHMTKVHPVPCNCPECRCQPCADPNAKPGAPGLQVRTAEMSKPNIKIQESVKRMDNVTLARSIQAANKENCECKEQIEEIKKTLERIKCACTEAEFRTTQNIAAQMGTASEMAPLPGKPFVKQASAFGQTMSGLKMALANLQAKCKAKDKMIEAMTGELEIRGDPSVFDKVLDRAQTPVFALDYDQAEDVRSNDRSQLLTDVIFEKDTADQSTAPCNLVCVASKGVEVRTHKHKKKKEKEMKQMSSKKLENCDCSIPQIIQKEEKDCQKFNLSGFEVIDIRRITDDSLIVKWVPPKSNLVSGYDIFVNGTLSSKVMSGSRTSAMMHSLDLSKSVQITIYAVSKCGRIEPPAIAIYEIKS